MSLPKVYIDGHAGTTGLRIREWLSRRDDIEIVTLPDETRKDDDARCDCMLASDIAVLCLPDDAAREAAAWVADSTTRLIDASTAHRVNDDWVYGLPELKSNQRALIKAAKLVSNPGCYSSSSVLLLRPLIDAGVINHNAPIMIHALSGYSGGGRGLIERWEDADGRLAGLPFAAPYALTIRHKHIPEIMKYAELEIEPQFEPSVGPFRCGMRVQIPLHAAMLGSQIDGSRIHDVLTERYDNETFVKLQPLVSNADFDELTFDPRVCNDTNRIDLFVVAHPSGHVLLMGIQDNLGKGASGMAIQSLNLMLGVAEKTGLPT
ncbi:MAG: N-acetyl-gamma-glutamyl-phosphate reductase [Gammaproteobacteria bacterium]|nr:N-acetyl-gamma-glutamyl-phosphate reductase [Gammaproteobacteria bacterium]